MKNINKIKLGGRIKIANRKIRTVKYIGIPNFVNENEKVIGLELDRWNPNACDGTICGKRVFDASRVRAYFIHCNSYTNIVPFNYNLKKGSLPRLQGLENCVLVVKQEKMGSNNASKRKEMKVSYGTMQEFETYSRLAR